MAPGYHEDHNPLDRFNRDKDQKFEQLKETHRLDVAEAVYPELIAALDYWTRVRGERFAPSLKEFRLEDLPASVIPCTVLVDIIGPPLDYLYRFFGTRMVAMSGKEMTGKKYYADRIQGYGFVNAQWLPVMIAERKPILTRTSWIAVSGVHRTTTTFRLPISADGERVSHGVTVNHFS